MSTHLQEHPVNLDPAACWNLLERVAAIPSLRRAARLREFLLYVGDKSLKQGRTDIHEQEIGETVFARPHAYDTSQDNIVRVSATELRKRVDAYFANEGGTEPIVFEIPRGSYLPVFRHREIASSVPGAAAHELQAASPAAATESRTGRVPLWAVSAVALLLGILCLVLWHQNAALQEQLRDLQQQHSAAR